MEPDFTRLLLQWNKLHNRRQMPWKGEKDPYRIWLSEVILQQTRVEQGWNYYRNFLQAYPDIRQLAAAPDRKVFKLWEGLGYYNRCRNLLFTARMVVDQFNSEFPATYEGLLALKGVGPYTAAAIASFAFNLPYAVVDGNVFRVLARYFGIAKAIDTARGKKLFSALAEKMLAKKNPGMYNQAIMDFGATVCKPAAPLCASCPMQRSCKAFQEGSVNQLPIKEKNLMRKTRWFYYFLFEVNGRTCVHQRMAKDIWQNLYEFYLFENESQLKWSKETVHQWLGQQLNITDARIVGISSPAVQQLTHQQIRGVFIRVELKSRPPFLKKYEWQPATALRELPFPRLITAYLESASYK